MQVASLPLAVSSRRLQHLRLAGPLPLQLSNYLHITSTMRVPNSVYGVVLGLGCLTLAFSTTALASPQPVAEAATGQAELIVETVHKPEECTFLSKKGDQLRCVSLAILLLRVSS